MLKQTNELENEKVQAGSGSPSFWLRRADFGELPSSEFVQRARPLTFFFNFSKLTRRIVKHVESSD